MGCIQLIQTCQINGFKRKEPAYALADKYGLWYSVRYGDHGFG